jgi:hypothetical protein
MGHTALHFIRDDWAKFQLVEKTEGMNSRFVKPSSESQLVAIFFPPIYIEGSSVGTNRTAQGLRL